MPSLGKFNHHARTAKLTDGLIPRLRKMLTYQVPMDVIVVVVVHMIRESMSGMADVTQQMI